MTQLRSHKSGLRSLSNHGTQRFRGSDPLAIRVVNGIGYVTQTGDVADYILHSGDVVEFRHRGEIVIEGLPKVEFEVEAL